MFCFYFYRKMGAIANSMIETRDKRDWARHNQTP